ncbi:MAG TPA: ATP-binding protein, partial [Luteimonas sp.]|nr:ATP-binding protein [Luteimonas sp.]
SVRSARHGLVGGSARSLVPDTLPPAGQPPVLYDTWIAGLPVRGASVSIWSPTEKGDSLVVSIAESLNDRQFTAREILLITIPIESLLILALFVLVWRGVASGLRILDAPIARLASRTRTLAPLSGPDIPIEILPFTRAIDGLFERIQALILLQERFVADAAHQLRTPLAGLAMHVERAVASDSDTEIRSAMQHVMRLTNRMTRSATQMLSLARAQAPQEWTTLFSRVDLASWLPEVVAARVPEALENDVDLGYEGTGVAAPIDAEPSALQELFDNLIDNALHHAPRGGLITVRLELLADDDGVRVVIEDDGPGVPEDLIGRLGERFFRTPGSPGEGSGLGLAIVLRIADVHGARVSFRRSRLGGLLVDLRFPRTGTGEA